MAYTRWAKVYDVDVDGDHFLDLVDCPQPCPVTVKAKWYMGLCGWTGQCPRLTHSTRMLPKSCNILMVKLDSNLVKKIAQYRVWINDRKTFHTHLSRHFVVENWYADLVNLLTEDRSSLSI